MTILAVPKSLLTVIAGIFSLSCPLSPVHHAEVLPLSLTVAHEMNKQPSAAPNMATLRRIAGKYASTVKAAAARERVAPKLVAAVLHVESGGDFHGAAHRVSRAGAIGPMQLMPNTAWNFLRVNPWRASSNIRGGAKYLHYLLRLFHGDVRMALVAYNAGPSAAAGGFAPPSSFRYASAVLRIVRSGSSAEGIG